MVDGAAGSVGGVVATRLSIPHTDTLRWQHGSLDVVDNEDSQWSRSNVTDQKRDPANSRYVRSTTDWEI